MARAFTGWSVGDGRWLAEGEEAPRAGQFHYVEAWHDPYQKRVLGCEFAPQRGPMADGDDVLDLLAAHPATARHVTAKLARRFLAGDPPADLVTALSGVFPDIVQAPDQIAQVLRALVSSEAFSATPPAKIRRPFEYLAALYRATGAGITATGNAHAWQLSRAGWQMHSYGPPAGHPDTAGAWTGASTLNRMVDMALYAHEAWFEIASADFAPEGPDESFGAFVARHAGALAPNRADEVVAVVQNIYDFDPAERVGDIPVADRGGLARMAVAFAALAVGSMRPGSLIGAKAAVAERLEDLLIGAGSWLAPQLRARLASGFGDHGALQVPMTELVSLSDALNALIWSEAEGAVRAYAPDQPYPEGNGLSEPLMTVAQAIKSDMGLRVATVDVPGWETHVNQADPFSGPARGLSEAVIAFWRDLGSWQQDVSVVVMSEFARRCGPIRRAARTMGAAMR